MTASLKSARPTTASGDWFSVAALLASAAVLFAIGFATRSIPVVFAACICGAMACFAMPRSALPAFALWLLVLLPLGFMDLPGIVGDFFTPAVIVVAIWMIRVAAADRAVHLMTIPIKGWFIAIPVLALLVASALASERPDVTFVWLIVFLICLYVPALIGQVCRDDVWSSVRWAFAGIGIFLGILAAVDFVFHFNPYLSLYREQLVGSSVFRTRTSLGHPLTTAMVAGAALMGCVFSGSHRQRWVHWAGAAGALTAVVLSVSRTSVIAVGLAAIVAVLSALPASTRILFGGKGSFGLSRSTVILLISVIFVAIAFSPLMQQRNAAAEGINSASYRAQVFSNALHLIADRPFLGFGPGTSTRVYEIETHAPLENSLLQLMISLGLPAFFLILAGLAAAVIHAMKLGRAGAAAGIVAFLISTAGFNIVDASPAFLAFVSPLIVCAVMPEQSSAAPTRGASAWVAPASWGGRGDASAWANPKKMRKLS